MTWTRMPAFVAGLIISVLLAAPFPIAALSATVPAQDATPVASDARDNPVLLFAAPGMRLDLVETFAADGALPALADMLANGAIADGGLLAPFPATTGINLPTLLTGAWPAEHGVVGDRFFRTGSPDFGDFADWTCLLYTSPSPRDS